MTQAFTSDEPELEHREQAHGPGADNQRIGFDGSLLGGCVRCRVDDSQCA